MRILGESVMFYKKSKISSKSMFPTQVLIASCPDGSQPTKTLYADGGYFEYKCGDSVFSVDLGKPVTPIAPGVDYKIFEDGYIAFNRLEYDVTVNFGDFESVIPSMDAVFLKEDGAPYLHSCQEGFILNNGNCLDTGLITYHYDNGEIKSEENYKDGKKEGKFSTWYKNCPKGYEEISFNPGNLQDPIPHILIVNCNK